MTKNDPLNIFVTCPLGVQYVLEQELKGLGLSETKPVPAGVYASAHLEDVYRVLMWSVTANRVLLTLIDEKVESVDDIYRTSRRVPWSSHFSSDKKIAISFSGKSPFVRNTTFGAMKVKDAIADYFRDTTGERPDVDKRDPDINISARLAKGRLSVSLDLSGESLHKRGYRSETGEAPLKENLAAAVLMLSGWPEKFDQSASLVDPMCGSGTFLVEGIRMATRYAPGLDRLRWGFDAWLQHDEALWVSVAEDARQQHKDASSQYKGKAIGFDQDSKVIRKAWQNLKASGLEQFLHVERKPLEEFALPSGLPPGLLVTNPPYGERLGDKPALKELYAKLGQVFETHLMDWKASVFTGDAELGRDLAWRSHKQYKLFNGAIESSLLLFELAQDRRLKSAWLSPEQILEDPSKWKIANQGRAEMFSNRLNKNDKQLAKWARRAGVNCYRLYDADMPEYAIAIDIYTEHDDQKWFHVQEYAPPAKVEEKAAIERLSEALAVLTSLSGCDGERIVLKTRRIQKGISQYEKKANSEHRIEVNEEGTLYEVNLFDYLDTGLFLDHRPLRRKLRQESQGKTCLNLFCYTGALSVSAVIGGAASVDSVDMSKTYLEWAKRNFELNGIKLESHRFIQSNVVTWLAEHNATNRYDLILLDPPSFSNSKRMDGVFDVQRDHAVLISQCVNMLNPGGTLIFSNNLRKFKLDPKIEEAYDVSDWKRPSLDKDFERNDKIHHCWLIQAKT